MDGKPTMRWHGVGRWLAFALAALLIRIVTSVLFVPINIGLLFDMLMAAMAAVAAQDLRRQAHANP